MYVDGTMYIDVVRWFLVSRTITNLTSPFSNFASPHPDSHAGPCPHARRGRPPLPDDPENARDLANGRHLPRD